MSVPVSLAAGSALARSLFAAPTDAAVASLLSPGLAAEGLLAQNFPRQAAAGVAIAIDGTAYFAAVELFAGQSIANVVLGVATAGTVMTLSKAGIYTTAGVRVAISADQGAAWQSAGLKTVPLTAPYVVPVTGTYYLALVAKGTVIPTLACGSLAAVVALAGAVGSGILPYGTQAAQTDLPANATIAAGAALGVWAGAS